MVVGLLWLGDGYEIYGAKWQNVARLCGQRTARRVIGCRYS